MTPIHSLFHRHRSWLSPCIKLIVALLVIPSTLSYLNLRSILQSANICFVGPDTSASADTGVGIGIGLAIDNGIASTADSATTTVAVVGESKSESGTFALSPSNFYGIFRSSSSSSGSSSRISRPLDFYSYTVDPSRVDSISTGTSLLTTTTQHHSRTRKSGSGLGRLKDMFVNFILQRLGYPSLLSLSDDLFSAMAIGSRRSGRGSSSGSRGLIHFDEARNSWCFQLLKEGGTRMGDEKKLCISDESTSTPTQQNQEQINNSNGVFPPSGTARLVQVQPVSDNNDYEKGVPVGRIQITCAADQHSFLYPYIPQFFIQFWNDKRQQVRENPNLEFLQLPTTTILILVNSLLALVYYNNRTDPSLICKEYHKIVHDHELWRAFTGATAHFEPLHIGFNMMGLYALGTELEPIYGSVPFLLYNICLIPLTTIVMMFMVWVQIRYTGDRDGHYQHTKSVGYSAVLFAWMVVSSLERKSTCPIPFMQNMCFKTYEYDIGNGISGSWILKFNFGPMVQLLIAQMIMPRVSFVGHLAGIVCGFVVHWKLLPREIFFMPQVLIPAIFIAHLWYVRKIISIQSCYGYTSSRLDQNDHMLVHNSPNRRKFDHLQTVTRHLSLIRSGMIVMAVMSCFIFNSTSSMSLSQVLVTMFVMFSSSRYYSNRGLESTSSSSSTLWKGTIVAAVLVILADALQMPYWISMGTYINAKWSICHILAMVGFMFARFALNFATLVIASSVVSEIGDCRGSFSYAFGWVVKNANMIGVNQGRISTGTAFTAFHGQGVTLGQV